MGLLRLIIVSLLFLTVVIIIWRLQKYRVPKIITRWFLIPFFVLFLILAFISNRLVVKAAENRVYSDVNLIPYTETALVLGADQKSAPEFFSKRIDAAFILYKAGKVKNFIVSGCVGRANYDEAANMKSALTAKGVPDSLIRMDKEGDHTLNSVVRCKDVYHKDKIVIVSQSYHAARAVYIASKNGIEAIGFYSGNVGIITPPKEYLSRLKAVFFQ